MLHRKYQIGETFSEQHLNSSITETERTEKAQSNYLHKLGSLTVSTRHFPVLRGGRFLGVVSTYTDVTEIQRLEQNIRKQLNDKGFVAKYSFADILTNNPPMQKIKQLAEMYATTDYAILIEGESGTGKELFAQSIHNASKRAKGPFVAVNCAAIPENLLESELFGYETGAFTGARKEGRSGLFEMASGGTIFLDEIGELPLQLQTRLLRVLQEKEIMRVGGSKIIPVDIRIISATNKNLRWMREKSNFRQDLYYRLNVLNVSVPPLRARHGDIGPICLQFYKKNNLAIDMDVFRQLLVYMERYSWPGNVRELQNIAQRVAFLSMSSQHEDIGEMVRILGLGDAGRTEDGKNPIHPDISNGRKKAVSRIERDIIAGMLEECGGDYGEAAARLKIGRTTLWRKMTQPDEDEEGE
jgi:transcriptional regulator with PAS, ATPase and Fis domain